MTSPEKPTGRIGRLAVITIDVSEFERSERFWCAVLGYEVEKRGPQYSILHPIDGSHPTVALQRVPEKKSVKNRVHLDVSVSGDLESAVRRAEKLGGSRLRFVEEYLWVVADPDGNELCLMPSRD